MQRKPSEMTEADVQTADRAVELAFTDPRRAAAMAEQIRRRSDAGPEARAVALRALGVVSVIRGDLDAAALVLWEAIGVAESANHHGRAGEARATLSYVLTLTGRSAEALAQVELAGRVLTGIKRGHLHMQRAVILTELGRFDEADRGFADSLRRLRRAGGSLLIEGDVHINWSLLHLRRGAWRLADEDLARAADLYRRAGHPGRLANVEHNRGTAAVTRGDFPAALAHLDEAERMYREQERDLGLIPVERAEALLSVRLVAEARAVAEYAVEVFARQRNVVDLVQARLVLAQAALAGGDPEVALAEAERARRAAVRQQRPGWAALAGYVALRARWDGGDRGKAALAAGRRALRALRGSGWVAATADAQIIVARLLLDVGRTTPARRLLTEAAGARRWGPAELRARAWHAEALLRLAAGDRKGSERALKAGMEVLYRFQASLGATELRTQVSSVSADLARLGMSLALTSGRPSSVLRWSERRRAGALLRRPARPPDDATLAALLAELREVTRRVGEAAAGGADLHGLLRRQAVVERSVAERARHAPGVGAGIGDVPSPAALSAALGKAVLVEYVLHDGGLRAVVVSGRRIELHDLGQVAPVMREIEALRFGLRRLAYGIGSPASLDAAEAMVGQAGSTLDDLLLSPLRLGAVAGAAQPALVLVPTGPLHALPWAALPSCAGRPVTLAPSAALWLRAMSSGAPASPEGRRVFVAGPGLEHAAGEVATLAAHQQESQRFTGRRARVEQVTAALDGAGLAHIAAHGRFRSDNPLFTSLALADGPLTVFDLERLRRPPLHVVLSACESGLPAVHPGDELLCLTAALLSMGTRSLVASVVPVPDDASVPLMLALHRRLRAGDSPAAALAAAQSAAAGTGSTRRARVAAAGFVCLGAG